MPSQVRRVPSYRHPTEPITNCARRTAAEVDAVVARDARPNRLALDPAQVHGRHPAGVEFFGELKRAEDGLLWPRWYARRSVPIIPPPTEADHFALCHTGELPLTIGQLKANGCEVTLRGNKGFTLSSDISAVMDARKLDFSGCSL